MQLSPPSVLFRWPLCTLSSIQVACTALAVWDFASATSAKVLFSWLRSVVLAPQPTSNCTTRVWPRAAAIEAAVLPSLFRRSRSAPAASGAVIIRAHVRMIPVGVPSRVRALRWDAVLEHVRDSVAKGASFYRPFATSSSTISEWPFAAAAISGVFCRNPHRKSIVAPAGNRVGKVGEVQVQLSMRSQNEGEGC